MRFQRIILLTIFLVGLLAVLHSHSRVKDGFVRRLNVLELEQSPYGEVLGMVLQDSVSVLFHKGQGHDHHSPGGGCSVCDECSVESNGTPVVMLKNNIQELKAYTRSDQLTSHRGSGFGQVQGLELVQWAYDLDPTNYGNYNIFSSFYFRKGLGGGDKWASTIQLAEDTILICERRPNNIADALTAASAEEIALILETKILDQVGNDHLRERYESFAKRVQHLDNLLAAARRSGLIEKYSKERREELAGRIKLFEYNLKGYKSWF